MILSILFWLIIVDLAAAAMFGIILIHDRIKYGVWAAERPDDDLS